MRVLIAEDDPSTRHLLRRLFSEWGHAVLVAEDADETWSMITDPQPPHIVILDAGLTKGGGLGLCRLMRDLPGRQRMHVIVSMAVVDSPSMVAAFEAGADDLVEKPFDMAELRLRVSAACAEVRLHLADGGGHEGPSEITGVSSSASLVAKAKTDVASPVTFPGRSALPAERQLTALASLTRQALAGSQLNDFSGVAVQQLAEVLDARQVQILERDPDGVSWSLRANLVARPVDPPCQSPSPEIAPPVRPRIERVSVEIGPGSRPYGTLSVELAPARQPLPQEIEFIASVAHLIGSVVQRQRLEQQVQQAQKMEIFGRLAGGIAHDFNNVLAVIGTGVASLETRTGADDEFREDVELIGQGVERGRLLARRLLRFSRSPSDVPTLIDLNTIVTDGQGMLERILVGQVALSTDVSLIPLVVRADRGEVEQVLLNLVLNARDAMPLGGVIRVTTSDTHPRSAAPDTRYAAFSVLDSGVGMDASTKARMFEPFFTTKPPGSGTGLGLSTVKEIVRRAEGCIEVDTTPGHGTKITVFWPCALPAELTAAGTSGAGSNHSAA